MSVLLTAIGFGALAIQLALIFIISRRKLRSQFGIFFNFLILLTVAQVAFQISAHWSEYAYQYVYWTFTALAMGLSLGVLYEVFVSILKPYSAVIDLGKMLFWWAAVFLFFTALVTALATTGSQFTRICTAILLVEKCVQLMQCGLLLLLLTFEKKLGLSWRSHGMCIALGLGTFAAMDLTITYVNAHYPVWHNTLDLVNGLVCLGVYAFLIAGLSLPEPARKTAQDSPTRLILQRWNDVLMNTPLVSRGPGTELAFSTVDSFIPGVEKTVDRVLSRKMAAS